MTTQLTKERSDPSDWAVRQDELFYHVVAILARRIFARASSVVDVGAGQAEILSWLDHIPHRVALDRRSTYAAPGIHSITADFMYWRPDRRYDLALCLQSLDRFKDPAAGAKRLLKTAKSVIITLAEQLVDDKPASAAITEWFGREPNYSYKCREITSDMTRIVFVYDQSGLRWTSVTDRSRQLRAQKDSRAVSIPDDSEDSDE